VRFWIELSGEHPTLPRAEALAALEAEHVHVRKASWTTQVVRFDAVGPVDRAVRRLGLAHLACEELVGGDLEDIREYARSVDLGGKTFRTRARALEVDLDVGAVEGALGADFGRTGHVDLANPSVEFRVLVADEFFLGRTLHRVDRSGLEARKVARRSFNLPISLHPKLARALVNLSRVPTGGLVLDPFCGTGGIILEASTLGLQPVASDVRRAMVTGARASLRSFGAGAEFAGADAGRGPWRGGRMDGIATDPPYGRAASTKGEPPLRLYGRSFASFAETLRPGGHAAVILPNEEAIDAGMDYLEVLERHAVRVHRSLTRNFCVFRKSQ
jgi:tRNA (guanine10-N2)-dimethyltransferase